MRLKQKSSFGVGVFLLAVFVVVCAYESATLFINPPVEAILVDSDDSSFGHNRRLATTTYLPGCGPSDGGGAYPDDPIISKPGNPPAYKNAPVGEKCGIIVHIIIVGYMLLGLNTVCDIYFCGALDVMVDAWKVKPDVAGATFMAAGGSAPELFTSLIGACITENDVGFGTIVGSAVFNVLAVIGACGMSAKEPISLSWWPLARDCSYYIFGLSLLAICAYGKAATDPCTGKKIGGGSISLVESIILFMAYLCYCTLMFFNEKLEKNIQRLVDKMKGRPPREEEEDDSGLVKVSPIADAEAESEAKPIIDERDDKGAANLRAAAGGDAPTTIETVPGPPEHHLGVTAEVKAEGGAVPATSSINVPSLNVPTTDVTPIEQGKVSSSPAVSPRGLKVPGVAGEPVRQESEVSASSGSPTRPGGSGIITTEKKKHIEHHIRVVHHKAHLNEGQKATMRRSMSNVQEALDGTAPEGEEPRTGSKGSGDEKKELSAPAGEPAELEGAAEEEESIESDDIAALMTCPTELKEKIIWYLSLPIYGPLYFCIPKPTEKLFLLTFVIALLFIAGFSFFLVYAVELFGQAILGGGNNVTIVMSFTILAAGTSIPDLVSSMAVARAGEGDMAVSSSIGSNIFDILVGLPVPWCIKIALVEQDPDFVVAIKSPYIALYVLLLLFMVFMVIISIHCLGWKLNQVLGYCMAALYVVFLSVVLPVELLDKGPYL